MRQTIKERLNKKLSDNNMMLLNAEPSTSISPTSASSTISTTTPTSPVAITLSDIQQEQLQRKIYENLYLQLQDTDDPYQGVLQTVVSDDGKLFMVLLFAVGTIVWYTYIKQNKSCEVNNR